MVVGSVTIRTSIDMPQIPPIQPTSGKIDVSDDEVAAVSPTPKTTKELAQTWANTIRRVQGEMEKFIQQMEANPDETDMATIQQVLEEEMKKIESMNQIIQDKTTRNQQGCLGTMKGRLTVRIMAFADIVCLIVTTVSSIFQYVSSSSSVAQQKANIGLGIITAGLAFITGGSHFYVERKVDGEKKREELDPKEVEEIRKIISLVKTTQAVKSAGQEATPVQDQDINQNNGKQEDKEQHLKAKVKDNITSYDTVSAGKYKEKLPSKEKWVTKTVTKLLPPDCSLNQTLSRFHDRAMRGRSAHPSLNDEMYQAPASTPKKQKVTFESSTSAVLQESYNQNNNNEELTLDTAQTGTDWLALDEWLGSPLSSLSFDDGSTINRK